jgi:NitT/TauT family transport system substrate-binding protein
MRPEPSRRGFLTLAAAASVGACGRAKTDPRALRLGYFANITHGPALTAVQSGALARALPGVAVTARVMTAGPEAMTALLAGSLDACFTGPIPAASAFLRSRGRALRCVSGVCEGGAVFVVREGAGIRAAADLRGRRVATPQLGNTQDVALRRYLRTQGLADTMVGGDVTVVNTANSNILSLFRQGRLDAAWVPEPWGARLLASGGRLLIDERDLWPGRAFATTLLVAHTRYLAEAAANVDALVDVTASESRRLRGDPARARAEVGAALRAIGASALPPAVVADAWTRIAFTTDPLPASVTAMARHAQDLGMFPAGELTGFFDSARVARARGSAET